jgi:hypothetical protein
MWSTTRLTNLPGSSRPSRDVSDSASRPVVVVADASPLIGLAKIARLDLLKQLFGQVLIPEAVEKEMCLGSGRPGSQVLAAARNECWLFGLAPLEQRLPSTHIEFPLQVVRVFSMASEALALQQWQDLEREQLVGCSRSGRGFFCGLRSVYRQEPDDGQFQQDFHADHNRDRDFG